jgi:hypothetical protein
MPGTFTKRVIFPIGGLNRSLAFQSQPPYTTCDCLNVWPTDFKTGRKRGARRPPLVGVGTTGYVSGISEVRVAIGSTYNRQLMAMVGGHLYKSSAGTSFTSVASGFTANAPIGLIPYGNQLYILDSSYKYYDFSDDTVHTWTADSPGTIPTGCTNGCVYLGRIVLVKDEEWFMSDTDNPLGWDFGPFIPGIAIQGSDFLGGKIGAPITAPIPYGDDTLLFACQDQIYILRGDPTAEGASLGTFCQKFGPVTRGAYCFGPGNEFVFLSQDGVYVIAGAGGAAEPLSKRPLPNEMLGITSTKYDACLAFDPRFDCVYVVATHKTDSTLDQQWKIDWSGRGFWPMKFTDDIRPMCAYTFGPLETDDYSPVLMGGSGLNRFQADIDDGEIFENYVVIGPVAMGNGVSTQGQLQQAVVKFSENTDDDTQSATISFVTAGDADSCKAAMDAGDEDRLWTTNVRALKENHWRCHPGLRGAVVMAKVAIPYTSFWSIEEIDLIIKPGGSERYL